jgi:hypothetical protein
MPICSESNASEDYASSAELFRLLAFAMAQPVGERAFLIRNSMVDHRVMYCNRLWHSETQLMERSYMDRVRNHQCMGLYTYGHFSRDSRLARGLLADLDGCWT